MTLTMLWRPHVVYVESSVRKVLDFELPQRPWQPMPGAIGGMRIAGSGVAAAYEVRHDEKREMRLRFYEHEWPAVRRWLRWAQQNPGTTFEWYDDQDDETTLSTVYLHAPAMGTDLVPTPDARFLSVWEIAVVFRISSGAHVDRLYFTPNAEFSLSPGDAISELGGSFARTGTVVYTDRFANQREALTGVLRDASYRSGARGILLEGARTQSALFSEQPGGLTLTGLTVDGATPAIDPKGVGIPRLLETADNSAHSVSQDVTIGDGEEIAVSGYFRARERFRGEIIVSGGGGSLVVAYNVNTGAKVEAAAGGASLSRSYIDDEFAARWGLYRLVVVGTLPAGVTTATCAFNLNDDSGATSYAGDTAKGAYWWGMQVERDAQFASSYVDTLDAPVSRNADVLSFSLPAVLQVKQAMSFYARFVELGTILLSGQRIYQIGNSGAAGVILFRGTGGTYAFRHHNGTTQTEVDFAVAPDLFDTVEILAVLNADGRPDIYQSVNGGAPEAIEGGGTAIGLNQLWSSNTLAVGSAPGPSDSGYLALQALRIARGVHGMDDMREMR